MAKEVATQKNAQVIFLAPARLLPFMTGMARYPENDPNLPTEKAKANEVILSFNAVAEDVCRSLGVKFIDLHSMSQMVR